jgi:DNA-directed RNA polymerase alpha subunit/DNA-directed RNA polymerase subunit L
MSDSNVTDINTYISSKIEDKGVLKFTLSGINVSIANGIRRSILSDIPILAFKTFPHNENQADFIKNTTRFNNEILKQRLGCIPINITDHSLPYNELLVEIHKRNDTKEMMFVTTKDFKIKNTNSDKYLDETTVRKIFPPNPITGDFILFARLRPKISNDLPGEEIKINAKMSLQTANEDGMYNCVSCCSYANTKNTVKQKDMWQEKLESLVKNHQDMLEQLEPDEVDKAEEGFQEKLKIDESDFYNHDAKRIFIPNSFDFQIESIGVFENNDICIKACDSLLSKLENIKKISEDGTIEVKIAETTLKNAYDIILQNEGYTIGKVIEYILNKQYYSGSKEYTFVGFRKDHPFDNYSRIRVAYNERVPNVSDTRVRQDIANACDVAIQIYGNIRNEFA